MTGKKSRRVGVEAEESLRTYFLEAGYFVVRGVPYYHDGLTVTDVDLWLYARPSPMSRLRAIVDAKRKNRPKALERIVWARGLKDILDVDQAIVATTDQRSSLATFGREHGVTVLEGAFLSRLVKRSSSLDGRRLSDEELLSLLGKDRYLSRWRDRLERAKERLLSRLEFDGCNASLSDIRFFMEQAVAEQNSPLGSLAIRLMYLNVAYFLITLDYISVQFAFDSEEHRLRVLADGFRYGSRGRERTERVIRQAGQLISAYIPKASGIIARISEDAERESAQVPADVLAQYFGKIERIRSLFRLAQAFEQAAYEVALNQPATLDLSLQGSISALLDYFGIERKMFFRIGGLAEESVPTSPAELAPGQQLRLGDSAEAPRDSTPAADPKTDPKPDAAKSASSGSTERAGD